MDSQNSQKNENSIHPEDSSQNEKFYIENDEDFNFSDVNVDEISYDDMGNLNLKSNEKIKQEEITEKKYKLLIEKCEQRENEKEGNDETHQVVQDYIRNFLVTGGFQKTFRCFQTEWFEKQITNPGDISSFLENSIDNVYKQNLNLQKDVNTLVDERNVKINDLFTRAVKECKFHRIKHKRLVQEKCALQNKLQLSTCKNEKNYVLEDKMNKKYKNAIREKTLIQLELDKAKEKNIGLESALKSMSNFRNTSASIPKTREEYTVTETDQTTENANDSKFPTDYGINSRLALTEETGANIRASALRQTQQITKAHTKAISGLSLHPLKNVIATGGDDGVWKLWSLSNCESVMEGKGHKEWISACEFHPSGFYLATSSGDASIKIWDFKKVECIVNFSDHMSAVWDISWHSCGDFIASASQDKAIKIWDTQSMRCRSTLRGHLDSVNSVNFLTDSNTLLTASADKSISLWDARINFCCHTLYGHNNTINSANFNLKGDSIVSCDSYGDVKIWDVRKLESIHSLNFGPQSTNYATFDPSASMIAVTSDEACIKLFDLTSCKTTNLTGHNDAVQKIIFDWKGKFLVSCGSDSDIKIWS